MVGSSRPRSRGFSRRVKVSTTRRSKELLRFRRHEPGEELAPDQMTFDIRGLSVKKKGGGKYSIKSYYRDPNVSRLKEKNEHFHETIHGILLAWHDHIRMPLRPSSILGELEEAIANRLPGTPISLNVYRPIPFAEIYSFIDDMPIEKGSLIEVVDYARAHFSSAEMFLLALVQVRRNPRVLSAMRILNTYSLNQEQNSRLIRSSLKTLVAFMEKNVR